jgi:hypothetical protein
MNVSSEIIALLVVTILLYVRPMVLVNFSNTLLGKALLIFIVVAASLQSTVSGILVALAIVVLAEMNYEGMESGGDSTVAETSSKKAYSQFDDIEKLRKKHCKDGKNNKQPALFVDSEGKEVPLDEIKKKFPYITFKDDPCNPCDKQCQFSMTEAEEQLVTDEALRPADSNRMASS